MSSRMDPNKVSELTQIIRSTHPLVDVPTPFYLRRFSYVHDGVTYTFDESLELMANTQSLSNAQLSDTPNNLSMLHNSGKRASSNSEGEEPAAKRREMEVDQVYEESPISATNPSDGAVNLNSSTLQLNYDVSGPARPMTIHEERFSPPLQNMPSTNAATPIQTPVTTSVIPGVSAGTLATSGAMPARISAEEPLTLLSPTASPRSPPSPHSDQDPDQINSDHDSPLIPSVSIGPLSARAFAPLPQSFTSDMSPLPPALPCQLPLHTMSQPVISNLLTSHSLRNRFTSSFPEVSPAFTSLNPARSHQESLRAQLSHIGDSFGRLPSGMHRYTLFNLLRVCDRGTLSTIYGELEQALRFDILSNLPPELSTMVLKYLEHPSLVAASEVSRNWYSLIDADVQVWQNLLEKAALHPTEKDIEAAKYERWGYTGWPTKHNRPLTLPTNVFGKPVNLYKAIYRRLELIHQNWIRPDVQPRRYKITCPDREVITCLDFSDDIIIASTEGKRHLNVYDTQTGELLHEFASHEGGVWALKRVGKDTIVSGSTDHTVRVWSLSKNRCTHVFRGHNATVRCLDVVMPLPNDTTRDYPIILTGSRDTTMRMWKLPSSEDADYDSKEAFNDSDNPYFLAELRGHTESVRAVCGYGDVAVSGSYDFRVRVWELSTRKCRHELKGHEQKVYAAIIDSERDRCISASMDAHIIIWDLKTGAQLYTLHGHTGLVGLVSLKDNVLVSAAADKTLRIWDPENGQHRHTLTGHNTAILCFVHDGRRVVSGSERHLKLWDARTGTLARDLLNDMELIWQVSFDLRRCVAAVARDRSSYLEILDFDFDPNEQHDWSTTPNSHLEHNNRMDERIQPVDDA